MQELSARDAEGRLSIQDQTEIDQCALADLDKPIKAPGQAYILNYLGDRWMAGKLAEDELKQLYKTAIRITLKTDPWVTQWNKVPICLECDCCLPGSMYEQWELTAHYKTIRIDGELVDRSDNYYRDYYDPTWAFGLRGNSKGEVSHIGVTYSKLGTHRLEVTLQIDLRRGSYQWPEKRPIMFAEVVMLNAEFKEQPPSTLVKCYRFLQDPQHEALHCLNVAQLQLLIEHPLAYFARPALLEFMRRRRLAETTPEEGEKLIGDLLAVQRDRSRHWFPEYGDDLEWLHDQHALSDSQWRQYGAQQLGFFIRGRENQVIMQGDPLPFEFVKLARRGNSKARRYDGAQWTFSVDFSKGITGPLTLGEINMGIDHGGDEYPAADHVSFTSVALGVHTMHAKLTDYDLTWTDRPADLLIPIEYDLGQIKFTVVPKTFDVVLKASGDKKIQVIKEVRTATGLGLKEAKGLVEGAPKTIKEALTKDEAEKLKKALEDQGATVELK